MRVLHSRTAPSSRPEANTRPSCENASAGSRFQGCIPGNNPGSRAVLSPISQRQAHAQRLAQSPVPFTAFELKVDGEVLACGQFAIEGDLVGIYDVYTASQARGRGLATALCTQLLVQARSHGARRAYLQVDGDNHAARAVYHRLGFADGYAYHYRTLDPDAA